MSPRTKWVACDGFCGRMWRGQIAVRLSLCLSIFTAIDTARRSHGTGRLRARRRIGHQGEQNGQSVLLVATETACCRIRTRLFVGVLRSLVTTIFRAKLRLPTISYATW
jgi:hypothetical protein